MRAWLRFGCGNLGLACTVCKYILLPKLKRHGGSLNHPKGNTGGWWKGRQTNMSRAVLSARDFVDSRLVSCPQHPTNTLASNASGWGFFFGCRCPPSPPLRTLSTATPSLAPKRESEGVPSCLFLPPQRLPAPRPCLSTPSLCCVSAPSCTTRLRPLCQRPSLHFGVCRCKAACRNSGAV